MPKYRITLMIDLQAESFEDAYAAARAAFNTVKHEWDLEAVLTLKTPRLLKDENAA